MITILEFLIEKTLVSINIDKNLHEILFITNEGEKYIMYHQQDCCENVNIEDIIGDINDLIGAPITMAEEVTSNENPKDVNWPSESFTWTFYKFATIKGYVTIRWYGESNGYYSEHVTFLKTI
jgi:hypothetical protein